MSDWRSESEQKPFAGARRPAVGLQAQREAPMPAATPSNEQLALFVKRIRRVMRDEKGRYFLGVAVGEGEFALYPDVIRVVEWMEQLVGANATPQSENGLKR